MRPRRRPGLARQSRTARRSPTSPPACSPTRGAVGRPTPSIPVMHPAPFARLDLPPGRSCRVSVPRFRLVYARFAAGTGLALSFTRLPHIPFAPATAEACLDPLPSPARSGAPARRRSAGRRPGAHQGHRRRRGHAREPADRLRPGGRPEQHRRQAGQVGVHPRVADRHAGAAGREHPRPGVEARHQEHRRGDGHRRAARLRPQRQPDRCRHLRPGRRHQPDRRHAAGHAAARRRWRGLCGGPGRARHRRDRRARRRHLGDPRRSHLGAHRQRRHGGARGRLPARQDQRAAPRAAQSRPDHRAAHRRRDQQGARPDRQGHRSAHRGARPAPTATRSRRSPRSRTCASSPTAPPSW